MAKGAFETISGYTCVTDAAGKYKCPRCGEIVVMKRGETYPNCAKYGVVVRWASVSPN
jgi:endogenous inhibitor of DNA gyrase (YacG/DUF329 family)